MTETTSGVSSAKSYLQFVDFHKLGYWDYYTNFKKITWRSSHPVVELREVLKLRKQYITIDDETAYKRCRVQLYGKGVVLRDEVPGAVIKTKKQQLCRPKDFLVAEIDAKFGGYGIVPDELEDAIVSSHYFLFEVDESKVLTEYLGLVAKTPQFASQVQATGSTNYSAIRPHHVLEYLIPLPTLAEQTQLIAAYYKNLQAVQLKRKDVTAKKDELTAMLNAEFGVSLEEKQQPKGLVIVESKDIERWGFEFATAVVTSSVTPQYPQKQIKQICKVSSGGTPSRNVPAYYKGGTIPWVKTTEVVNAVISSTEECITELALQNSSAKLYQPGSLIIAMYGQGATRGRTAKLGIPASTNQACAVLYDIKNDIILTNYLWIYLMNEYDRLREMASGNNQPNLNAGMIKNYKIQIPSLEKQQQIIDTFFTAQDIIQELRTKANVLEAEAVEAFESAIFMTNV